MSSSLCFLVFLLALCAAVLAQCPESDQIHCRVNDRCTRIRYICDGDNDCGDGSDEDDELCQLWRQPDCERGYAKCYRYGSSDCMPISRYCELQDPPCEGDVDPRLCKMLSDVLLQDLDSIVITQTPQIEALEISELEMAEAIGEEFKATSAYTLNHEGCPPLFTKIADSCISVFYPANVTWGEASMFCHLIGGELISLNKDYVFYATLLQHLREHQMTADFWIGGMRLNDTSSWTWMDKTAISLNSPYWAVRHTEACHQRVIEGTVTNITRIANKGHCYNYEKAPAFPMAGHCLALTYETYFQMVDHNCLEYKSPLCILNAS